MPFLLSLLFAFQVLAEPAYRIRLEDNRVVTLSAEDYVTAVVAGEAGTLQSREALRAMAVVARTCAFRTAGRHRSEGFDFCVTTHCQRALPGTPNEKAIGAQHDTAGEMLWWEGHPAFSVYSQDCGGETEAVRAVWPDANAPYLQARTDPYCTRVRPSEWTASLPWTSLGRALVAEHLRVPDHLSGMDIAARSPSGRARLVRLHGNSGSVLVSASSLRFAAGRHLGWTAIRSDRYEVDGNRLHGRGQGHGVGLCQVGADEMGNEGLNYRAILRFYYPGVSAPSRSAIAFRWTRIAGERLTILTVRPNRDAGLLAEAQRSLAEIESRLHTELTGDLEIFVYPDVDAFRNATGEPGWIAGRYRAGRIDLQPTHDPLPTLRHEIMHAVLEQQAVPGLPVWFREGLAGALSHGDREAVYRVRRLIERHGENTVIGWLKSGLPPAY